MKIYILNINFGKELQELTFSSREGAIATLNRAKTRPHFIDATLETLSNGGDDLKPFYTDDFEEYDIETGELVSD